MNCGAALRLNRLRPSLCSARPRRFMPKRSPMQDGRFRFRALTPGEYIVAIFIPGKGEVRQTVELGPGTADAKGRVDLTIHVNDSLLVSGENALPDRAKVSTRELSIPESARHEYADAQKSLGRHDTAEAVAHLQRAVAIAPQFTSAWNNLGTIAYQTKLVCARG